MKMVMIMKEITTAMRMREMNMNMNKMKITVAAKVTETETATRMETRIGSIMTMIATQEDRETTTAVALAGNVVMKITEANDLSMLRRQKWI